MSQHPVKKIFTFYSYKGGTGRTMSLANVAWILASNGMRVLIIDWDLEAPGLHRFFAPFLSDPNLEETDGLIEFLSRYMVAATKLPLQEHESDQLWYQNYADIKRFSEPIQWRFPHNGSIDLVGAGRQIPSYGMRINRFDWDGFYSDFGGGAFLDAMIRQMKENYDYILVDSRTGISDTSGICTVHLPDSLVIFYTLNNQSIEGASGVAKDVAQQRIEVNSKKDTFHIFTMATRVELAEKEKLQSRRRFAQNRFAGFLDSLSFLSPKQRDEYWGKMEVLYDPYYAYEEVLATIADEPDHPNSVLAALEHLTQYLTNGEIRKLGEMSESKRSEALDAYFRLGSTKLKPNIEPQRAPETYDVFISNSTADKELAERLYFLLESSYRIFYTPKSIQPGDIWGTALHDAIEHSRLMVILLSQNIPTKGSQLLNAEINVALDRQKRDPSFKILPVSLHPDAFSGAETGKKLRDIKWLNAWDRDVQDVSVRIRKLLGTTREGYSETERKERLELELEQALNEKSSLTEKTKEQEAELKKLSKQKDAIIEKQRTKQRLMVIIAVLAFFISIMFDIPQKIESKFFPKSTQFVGQIIDINSGSPIAGAEIELFEKEGEQSQIGVAVTKEKGTFKFIVNAKKEEIVWATVKRNGYRDFQGYIALAGPQVVRLNPALSKYEEEK